MKFKIEFDCDNDAFVVNPEAEVADLLENVAYRVKQGETYGKVFDTNGNSVGNWEFTDL
jgi:hypothetical protein